MESMSGLAQAAAASAQAGSSALQTAGLSPNAGSPPAPAGAPGPVGVPYTPPGFDADRLAKLLNGSGASRDALTQAADARNGAGAGSDLARDSGLPADLAMALQALRDATTDAMVPNIAVTAVGSVSSSLRRVQQGQ